MNTRAAERGEKILDAKAAVDQEWEKLGKLQRGN